MEKKFKVRVDHFAGTKYTVDYANYYLIQNWKPLCYWFSLCLDGSSHDWAIRLYDYEDAERMALTLKSIEDVNKWYKIENKKRDDFYAKRKEYLKRRQPYTTKIIK